MKKTAKIIQNLKNSIDLKVALKLMLSAKVNHAYTEYGNQVLTSCWYRRQVN